MSMPGKTIWSKLSLTAKGLILLSIPLCLQLGFGIMLIQLQLEAESAARRANEARTIETQINSLVSDGVQLFTRCHMSWRAQWQTEGYRLYLPPRSIALLRQVQEKYTNLDNLTKDKPVWNSAVKQSFSPLKEVVEMIEQTNNDLLAGNIKKVRANNTEMSDRFTALGNQFIAQDPLFLAKDRADLVVKSTEKQDAIRQATVKCAFAVIFANIIFSLLPAIFLVQTMISRLRTMADNAARLAAHQPLNPPLAGEDEIVQLDRTFHRMACTIDESAQTQQDLYNTLTEDLRTPITAIQGFLEVLDQGHAEEFSERAKKLIRVAVRSSARTIGLVDDLLDSQKLEAGMLELDATTVHLADVFDNINQDLSSWIEESGLQLSFASTKLMVTGNQDMLTRILFNLISNAIKYSPRGGTIAVNITPVSTMAEITVSDQGPGIPKHMLKAVFERFRQVSGSDPVARAGSGLGLTICQDFVHLHGGEIWATSEIGRGSTFHFTIPLA